MFKIGNRIRAKLEYCAYPEWIGIIAEERSAGMYLVMWETSKESSTWNEHELILVVDGNDILKDLCSK